MIKKTTMPSIHPIMIETDQANLRTYNFYLVETGEHLILVDTGYDSDQGWESLQRLLKKKAYTISDLDAILLTHHHFDHVGLVNRIVEQHPIPVYAHKESVLRLRRDPQHLKRRIRFFNNLYLQMGCDKKRVEKEIERLKRYVDTNEKQIVHTNIELLEEGDQVFNFEVLEVMGHSLDHLAFYHRESKQILVGDHMIKHMSSNALIDLGPNGERPLSLVMYEKSLKRLFDLPIELAFSGHGEVIDQPYPLLEEKLERIEKRGNLILQMLFSWKTPAQIAKEVYKERYDSLFPLVMSEIIGHIDRLEYYGQVKKREKNGVFYYERARPPQL